MIDLYKVILSTNNIKMAYTSTSSSQGKHHRRWIFTVRLPQIAKTCHGCSINSSVVTTPRYGHDTNSFHIVRIFINKSWKTLDFTECSTDLPQYCIVSSAMWTLTQANILWCICLGLSLLTTIKTQQHSVYQFLETR